MDIKEEDWNHFIHCCYNLFFRKKNRLLLKELDKLPSFQKSKLTNNETIITPLIIGILEDTKIDNEEKFNVLLVLKKYEYDLMLLLPVLIELINQEEPGGIDSIASSLLGGVGPKVIPALIPALREGNEFATHAILDIMLLFPKHTKQYIPVLIELFKNSKSNFKEHILRIFYGLGCLSLEAIPSILKELESTYSEALTKKMCIYTLGQIDTTNKEVARVINRFKEDPNEFVKKAALEVSEKFRKEIEIDK